MRQIDSSGKVMALHDGEPIFVIRAADNNAVGILMELAAQYELDEAVVESFIAWRAENQNKCKDPD